MAGQFGFTAQLTPPWTLIELQVIGIPHTGRRAFGSVMARAGPRLSTGSDTFAAYVAPTLGITHVRFDYFNVNGVYLGVVCGGQAWLSRTVGLAATFSLGYNHWPRGETWPGLHYEASFGLGLVFASGS